MIYNGEENEELGTQNATSKYQREAEFEKKVGTYLNYYFYPDGKHVWSKNLQKFLTISHKGNIPYISLSENGISHRYRLDQVMFRAFNCWYQINSKDIIHRDDKQDNCGIKNLYIIE
jgi:hypothetical protein